MYRHCLADFSLRYYRLDWWAYNLNVNLRKMHTYACRSGLYVDSDRERLVHKNKNGTSNVLISTSKYIGIFIAVFSLFLLLSVHFECARQWYVELRETQTLVAQPGMHYMNYISEQSLFPANIVDIVNRVFTALKWSAFVPFEASTVCKNSCLSFSLRRLYCITNKLCNN